MPEIKYAFFGTGALAESVLATLVRAGYIPSLLVTKTDSPSGRHMEIKSPHIKTWADLKNIKTFQPDSLKNLNLESPLHAEKFDVFIVASYGKIIPDEILQLPAHGVLNVHPSLLPLYRGPSPIESVLLDGKMTTGVSIIKLDNEVDHGPIIVQSAFMIHPEETSGTLEVNCGQLGGELLVQTLQSFVEGNLIPKEQDHSKATFCKKIDKSLGEISLNDSIEIVRRKYRALTPWPGIHFFYKHKGKELRVKITQVDLLTQLSENDDLQKIIKKVIPEGKKEMDFESFLRGYKDN